MMATKEQLFGWVVVTPAETVALSYLTVMEIENAKPRDVRNFLDDLMVITRYEYEHGSSLGIV